MFLILIFFLIRIWNNWYNYSCRCYSPKEWQANESHKCTKQHNTDTLLKANNPNLKRFIFLSTLDVMVYVMFWRRVSIGNFIVRAILKCIVRRWSFSWRRIKIKYCLKYYGLVMFMVRGRKIPESSCDKQNIE
jgi:hypothetical protein